jgi:hypothetical protein
MEAEQPLHKRLTAHAQSASDSTAHEQLFSLGVKRYLFQLLFKNVGEKQVFQEGDIPASFSPIFKKGPQASQSPLFLNVSVSPNR